MTKPRPCGCKGCRTCLICETHYGADNFKKQHVFDKSKGYVYCPFCNKAWQGWEMDTYKRHPYHKGNSIDYPGIHIQLEFLTHEEETRLMNCIDEMPWDNSQSGRRKQNFGPKTNFKKRKVTVGQFGGFPEFSKFIQERFESVDLLKNFDVVEQCSLEYDPAKGASIDPHIDDCWIWGERIVTVNCLSDTVLTMVPFKGDTKKYNLDCAKEFHSVISKEGSIVNINNGEGPSVFETSKPLKELDLLLRIPMPRFPADEERKKWTEIVQRICKEEFWKPSMHDLTDSILRSLLSKKEINFMLF